MLKNLLIIISLQILLTISAHATSSFCLELTSGGADYLVDSKPEMEEKFVQAFNNPDKVINFKVSSQTTNELLGYSSKLNIISFTNSSFFICNFDQSTLIKYSLIGASSQPLIRSMRVLDGHIFEDNQGNLLVKALLGFSNQQGFLKVSSRENTNKPIDKIMNQLNGKKTNNSLILSTPNKLN